MELKEAIEVLTYHQDWRRGNIDEMKYEPKTLGIAIDVILESFKCQCEIPIVRGVNPEYCGNCGKSL